MAVCGKCGTENPEGSEICVNCGAKIDEPRSAPKRSLVWTLAAVISIVLGLSTIFIESTAVTIAAAIIALVLAILSLVKKARLRAISVIAVVVSGIMLLLWGGSAAARFATEAMTPDPKEYTCGRVVFTIPGKFLSEVEETPDGYDFSSDIGMSFLYLNQGKGSIPDDQFKVNGEYISNELKDSVADSLENVESEGTQYRNVGDLACLITKYTGTADGKDVVVKVAYVNDPESDCGVNIINLYYMSDEIQDGDDLEEILDNARFDSSIKPFSDDNAAKTDAAE